MAAIQPTVVKVLDKRHTAPAGRLALAALAGDDEARGGEGEGEGEGDDDGRSRPRRALMPSARSKDGGGGGGGGRGSSLVPTACAVALSASIAAEISARSPTRSGPGSPPMSASPPGEMAGGRTSPGGTALDHQVCSTTHGSLPTTH